MANRNTPFIFLCLLSFGCENRDEDIATQVGDKVGQVATDFASGIGRGIDKRMEVNVELSDEITALGISKTVSKKLGTDPMVKKGIAVYLIAEKALKAELVAKAIDSSGLEIGRSVVDVEFTEDDAKYVTFDFDIEMDTQLVEKYSVAIRNIESTTPGSDP